MAIYDVRINGTSLMSLSYGVDVFEGRRAIPARRLSQTQYPGMHGVIPRLGSYEPHQFKIGMWVLPSNPGVAPSAAALEQNITKIMALLTQRQTLVEWEGEDGQWRRAVARLTAAVTPVVNHDDLTARIELLFENPYCFWQSINPVNLGYTHSTDFHPAAGSTGPIWNISMEIVGPVQQPMVSVKVGGQTIGYIQYLDNLTSGQSLIIDTRSMKATVGSTNVTHRINTSGFGAQWFEIPPNGVMAVGGTAMTTNTRILTSCYSSYI